MKVAPPELPTRGAVVQVKGVNKTFLARSGQSVRAIEDVSFNVGEGEFVSLVGPSGCGKSTILKMLAGLIPFESGSIDVGGMPAHPGRREVGIMLQSAVLMPWRNVLDNVLLPMEIFGEDMRAARKRALDLVSLVGLEEFQEKYPAELSGGMQQRASLCRLLIYDPAILLMDEPFGALDEFTRLRLNVELAALHEKFRKSVVFVTHNISEAVLLSDRVVTLSPHPGRIVNIVNVTLPRPRVHEMIDSPEMAAIMRAVRSGLIDEQGGAAAPVPNA